MTATARLMDRVEVVDLRDRAGPGDDGMFIAAHGGARIGWYGPVGAEVGRRVDLAFAGRNINWPIADHRALYGAVRQAIGPIDDAAASWALGAVDCAIWDLHGQLARLPVARLLSNAAMMTVPLYASWLRLNLTDPSAADTIATVGRGGWLFTKWGLRQHCGSPATESVRLGQTVHAVVAALRRPAAFDAVFTWHPALATAFADHVDDAALTWIEDPLPGDTLVTCRELLMSLPLAIGERFTADADERALLDLRPKAFTLDVVGSGGLTRAIDLVAAARAAGVPVFPHGRSFIPGLHLCAAFPRTVAGVEYRLEWEPRRQRLYTQPLVPRHGRISLPTTPGLGATPRNC